MKIYAMVMAFFAFCFIIIWGIFHLTPSPPQARVLALPGSMVIIGRDTIISTDTLEIKFTNTPKKYKQMTTPIIHEFPPAGETLARDTYREMCKQFERVSLVKFPDGRWGVLVGDPTAVGKVEIIEQNF